MAQSDFDTMLVANMLFSRLSGQAHILKLPKDVDVVVVVVISQHPFIGAWCSSSCCRRWPGARAARPLAGLQGPSVACSDRGW